jgi:hypothetical protein
MKFWYTEIKAISPVDGALKVYCGPNVPGINEKTAQEYCENNGLGYCKVIGELIAEIPCKEGTQDPDFENMMDYTIPQIN